MTFVAQMLLSDPTPLVIWLILLVVAALSFVGLARPDLLRDLRPTFVADFRMRREQRRQQAADDVRYAEEVTVAAQRATQAADRWQAVWRQAEQHAATAWLDWQNAEQRLVRLRPTAVFAMSAARSDDEAAARQRFLRRRVGAAIERGDLPAGALDDFDPSLHPVDLELAVFQACAAYRKEMHRLAAARKQSAWHDTQLAIAARDSLQDEAAAAIIQAASVRHLVPPTPAPRPTRRRLAALPQVAYPGS